MPTKISTGSLREASRARRRMPAGCLRQSLQAACEKPVGHDGGCLRDAYENLYRQPPRSQDATTADACGMPTKIFTGSLREASRARRRMPAGCLRKSLQAASEKYIPKISKCIPKIPKDSERFPKIPEASPPIILNISPRLECPVFYLVI